MERGTTMIFFLVYLLVGLYFVNSAINFIKIPSFVEQFDKWISLVGGFLIIIGGFYFLKVTRSKKKSQ